MTFTLIAAALVAPAADPLPVSPGPLPALSPTAAPPASDAIPLPLSPVALAPPAACADGSRYFFTLFGGQSLPFRPRTGHTWATFAKTTPTTDGKMLIESFTISWLPATGD